LLKPPFLLKVQQHDSRGEHNLESIAHKQANPGTLNSGTDMRKAVM
jgi:hypothetical protein